MKLLFWRNKKLTTELEAIEREATKVHKKNITKIRATRSKADTLNTVLRENNITLQLARAIGHRH